MAVEVLMDRTFVFDSIPSVDEIREKINLGLPIDYQLAPDFMDIFPRLFYWFSGFKFDVLFSYTQDSSDGWNLVSLILYDNSLSIEENLKFLHVLTLKNTW